MKLPQTKFHGHTMSDSQFIRSKKSQNLSLGQTYLAAQFFLVIDILLKLQQQMLICIFSCNSIIILIVGLLWLLA